MINIWTINTTTDGGWRRLTDEAYELFKPAVKDFIDKYVIESTQWQSQGQIKMTMCPLTHYFYAFDMNKYLNEFGFQASFRWRQYEGDFACKARIGKRRKKEIDLIPRYYETIEQWQKRTSFFEEPLEEWKKRVSYSYYVELRKIQQWQMDNSIYQVRLG